MSAICKCEQVKVRVYKVKAPETPEGVKTCITLYWKRGYGSGRHSRQWPVRAQETYAAVSPNVLTVRARDKCVCV